VHFRVLLKAICLLAGAAMALMGLTWLGVAWSGAVRTGGTLAVVAGLSFLLAAVPIVVFAFSPRRAKPMAVGLLFPFAFGMLWLAFRPDAPVNRQMLAQAAAIAFAVLLLARVGLALRRKRIRGGT
jgi:hypothetical protein